MEFPMNKESTFQRALRMGIGFGAAISIVHLTTGIGLIVALGMPPMTGFAVNAFIMEFLLGILAALLLAPLFRLPKAEWVLPVALTIVWVGLERFVAVDPSKLNMWIGPSIGGLVVFAIGRKIFERNPKIVYGLVTVLPLILLSVPMILEKSSSQFGLPADIPDLEADAPDVLVIVMDTVRAQSSSTYGYDRQTTPTLDRIAKEGLLFKDANAPATWSLPAHASIFTGTFPSWNNAHGETRYLDDTLPTLAETLGAAGYETRCFSANPHISDAFGLTRGFMYNDEAWRTGEGGRGFSFIYRLIDTFGLGGSVDKGGQVVVENIEEWMDSRSDRPAFVFVNFLEAHFPFHQLPDEYLYEYQQGDIADLREAGQVAFGVQFGRQLNDEEFNRVRQPLVDMYDAGILYTDFLVSQVLKQWEDEGRLDNTVVVILGDHGEVMGEHRAFGHVTPVTEQDFRVPLLMRYPAKIPAGSVIEPAVSTIGTFATIMDMLDYEEPSTVQMSSLLPGIHGAVVGQPVLAERFEEEMLAARFAPGTANGVGPLVNPRGRYRSFRTGPYKLVQHSTDGTVLFNLEVDPMESNDLSESHPEEVVRIESELAILQKMLGLPNLDADVKAPRIDPGAMDAGTMEALRELGYIE
jgi:arylsulfatase A-like enzyme